MKKLITVGAAITVVLLCIILFLRESPGSWETEASAGAPAGDFPGKPRQRVASPDDGTPTGEEMLNRWEERYAQFSPGQVIEHQADPMADVYLVRATQGPYPVLRFVRLFEEDIDTGERIVSSEMGEAAGVLSVRLKQGVPVTELKELAQAHQAAVLKWPASAFEDGLIILPDASPHASGAALNSLRTSEKILHVRPVTVEMAPPPGA